MGNVRRIILLLLLVSLCSCEKLPEEDEKEELLHERAQIRKELKQKELELYDTLLRMDTSSKDAYDEIRKMELRIGNLAFESSRVEGSIQPGEVIGIGPGPGSTAPTGKYRKVLEMREEIGRLKSRVEGKKCKIAQKRGGLVKDPYVARHWQDRAKILLRLNKCDSKIRELNRSIYAGGKGLLRRMRDNPFVLGTLIVFSPYLLLLILVVLFYCLQSLTNKVLAKCKKIWRILQSRLKSQ